MAAGRASLDAALDAALRLIAPPGVKTGCRKIDAADIDALTSEERAAVRTAVPRRQQEFATGRVLLRQLLGTQVAIPVRPDRAPDLPPGVIASLAHDDEFAIAAVSTDDVVAAVGLDIEPTDPLAPDIAELIVRPDEGEIDAHLAFTLKEAAYKAWSTAGGRILEHHDVRLVIDGRRFTAEVVDDGSHLDGRYVGVGGHWIAIVVLPRRSLAQ